MNRLLPFAAALFLAGNAASAGQTSCHIHPPGSSPESPRGTIGPFDSAFECETERLRRFGAGGRCHCVAGFSPRWVPPAPALPPGQSPLG